MDDARPEAVQDPAPVSTPLDARPQAAVPAAASNAAMADTIMGRPAQPFTEGGYVLRVAEIVGRRSGSTIRVPTAAITNAGRHYLVSPTATRQWARNLTVHPHLRLVAAGISEAFLAVPAEPGEAIVVLRLYVSQLGWAADQFPFDPADPDDEIRARLPEVAVYRLDPPAPDAGTDR